MLLGSVVEKCCEGALWRSLVEKCCRGLLEKNVVEKFEENC